MRQSAVDDCAALLKHFEIDPAFGRAIDVGGTRDVYLDSGFTDNPLSRMSPGLHFLDKGFNVELIKTEADSVVDFLDPRNVDPLRDAFDLVYCFDTLEHVSNPFLFCEHLVSITRPGRFIFLTTVFEWPYHPSPEDYFRFSPSGLVECFRTSANRGQLDVLWFGWGSDPRGVNLLARRSPAGGSNPAGSSARAMSSMRDLLGPAFVDPRPPRQGRLRRIAGAVLPAPVKDLIRRFIS